MAQADGPADTAPHRPLLGVSVIRGLRRAPIAALVGVGRLSW